MKKELYLVLNKFDFYLFNRSYNFNRLNNLSRNYLYFIYL